MHLFYSRDASRLPKGAQFRNVRHFGGAEKGAKQVTIDGDHPKIAEAYEVAGVPVSAAEVDPAPAAGLNPDAVTIPTNWRSLEWPALRKLAGSLTDGPVSNKPAARRVIEREVGRRASGKHDLAPATAGGQVAAVEAAAAKGEKASKAQAEGRADAAP